MSVPMILFRYSLFADRKSGLSTSGVVGVRNYIELGESLCGFTLVPANGEWSTFDTVVE